MAVIPFTPLKTFSGLRLFAAVTDLLKSCFPKELGSPTVGAREMRSGATLTPWTKLVGEKIAKRKRRRNNAATLAGDPR